MLRNVVCLGLGLAFTLGALAPVQAEDDPCLCRDIVVSCTITPGKTVLVGDPFEVCATVENVGSLDLEDVRLAIRGCPSSRLIDGEQLAITIPKLAIGESKTHCVKFIANDLGLCRVSAHATDSTRIAAAGCICSTAVEGLPAIQLEMIDVDLQRQAKGIFKVGEEFIYTLKVENDVGTSVTPDLSVVWTLPAELEFVRGVGTSGGTVTGSGQDAKSSMFALAPNQVQEFEIICRVIGVPARNLTQTRASVLTSGGQELALETESTTLKR